MEAQDSSTKDLQKSEEIKRRFPLTDFSLKNRTTVLLLTVLLAVSGIQLYLGLPKDSFPEVKINQIYVGTPYPGNSPIEVENLITRPLEQEINNISSVDKITSVTVQDYSVIIVEFPPSEDTQQALLDVKDAVDKAKPEFPSDLDEEPNVFEFDFANLPILNINLTGNYDISALKSFAEDLQERIERIGEVAKVEIRGVDEKEVEVLLDPYKMDAVKVTFSDIQRAIASENMNMSGGDILDGGLRRSLRIEGQISDPKQLEEIVVKHEKGNIVHLKELAKINFGYRKEKKSYARLSSAPVVSIDVVKRSGENLIITTDKVMRIIAEAQRTFPTNLSISTTNDQSQNTRNMVQNLENNIISGVILVVLVLQFFLGIRNALFVGFAIPMSMFLSFCVLAAMDATINMMILFSLIMALGMLVDNGIVVVENAYRLLEKGKSPMKAVKQGVGEVAWPIIVSTLTTLVAFFPLLVWPGLVGEFMKYLPMTLIITLSSSLFVALIINPIIIMLFIKPPPPKANKHRRAITRFLIICAIGAFFLLIKWIVIGNLLIAFALLILLQIYVLTPSADLFQTRFLPALETRYKQLLTYALQGTRPYVYITSTVALLIGSFVLMGIFTPPVLFFPNSQPNLVNVFIEFPIGTDIETSNRFASKVEKQVMKLVEPYDYMVESVMTKAGLGSADPDDLAANQGETPHRALVTVHFKEFKYRQGVSTEEIMTQIRKTLSGYPGVRIAVEKDRTGPPVGKAISIEVIGEDLEILIETAKRMQNFINSSPIAGIESLKIDPAKNKPELTIHVDKEKARRYGLSTSAVASEIRTSLFGREVSKYKEGEEDYAINLRLAEEYKHDIQVLLNKNITFRDASTGRFSQVPISSVASVDYDNTYNQISRKDLKRVVTLSSNVLSGFNATKVNDEIRALLNDFDTPNGYEIRFSGEQERQAEEMAFLSNAFLIAVFLIFLVIIAQFNTLSSPLIIMATILFSSIGVLLGLVIFQMNFIVIMTMIGLISLAGIVVNNGIVLLDFIVQIKAQKRRELGLERLPFTAVVQAVIQAGETRMRPVLLTAITTILGLIPLAVGLNIDFIGLFTTYDPNVYMGGGNVDFWAPMCWTIIFGLSFATFLTLVIVPVMYWIFLRIQYVYHGWKIE